jgi:ribonuclease E
VPVAALAEGGEAPVAEGGEREGGRRRGRGRDRNRREARDTADNGADTTAASPADTDQSAPVAVSAGVQAQQAVVPAEVLDSTVAAAALDLPAVAEQPVANVAPVAVAPVVMAPVVVAAPPVPAAPVVAAVAVVPYALPTDALHALAASSGLEWVNSDAEKIRIVRETMAAEPKQIHVPREPRPPVVIDEGPLVLVETKKDLSQLKLPFEATR